MPYKKYIENATLVALYVLVGLLKTLPNLFNIVAVLVICSIFYYAVIGQLCRLAPLFLFFNSSILFFQGVALTDVFFAAYIFSTLLRRPYINKKNIHPMIIVFLLYSAFVISKFNFFLSVEIILTMLFLALFLNELYENKKWYIFCQWFIIALFSAMIYGLTAYLQESTLNTNVSIRFVLAFTDPNYAGLFLSIGLYMLIFQKDNFLFLVRAIGIVACSCFILLTLSSSALICNVVVLFVWGISNFPKLVTKKNEIQKVVIFVIAAVFLICILQYFANNMFPEMQRAIERFVEKILLFRTGNLDSATTDRSSIWNEHLNFYINQNNMWKVLFGGNYLTDRGFDTRYFDIVSHQTYIDSLLCFGLFGTGIYVASIINQLYTKWKRHIRSDNAYLIFIITIIWFTYSFILSTFPFWAFSLLLFINVKET